jgi:S-formylglutathione hydrolase FrmB
MVSAFGVSPDRSNWGAAGWSMGGTCAVDLAAMHPDKFSAFLDIAGDYSPNTGSKTQTIARLFGGNADAWAAFDPSTVIDRHGHYNQVAGWFAISSESPAVQHHDFAITDNGSMRLAGREAAANPNNQPAAAYSLCARGRANGIDCAVVPQSGKHDWPFADRVFAAALPWLAGQLGTPGIARIPLPDMLSRPAPVGTTAKPAEHSR